MAMIEYDAFTKSYNGKTVVDSLTLTVPPGAVVALLGPNGSGKTTTIKAAAGLIRPDSGRVRLGAARLDAGTPEARRSCSFLPQHASFPEGLTGREVVEFYRRLRHAPAGAAHRVLLFASLNGAGSRPVSTYSGGMVQRLGLAVATIDFPDVLLLDEPTAALDPDGLCAFYGLIEQRRKHGGAVFFSSHQLGDVERLADQVAVIVNGRLVAQFTERQLAMKLADRGLLRVRLAGRIPGLLESITAKSPHAQWFGDELIIPGAASERPPMLDLIRDAGGIVTGLTAQEGRLDDFYRELVGASS
jgi:Cu-processing system ATP-binding protein